ncbi:MAG TPA: NPCBM/NEW2 domain-containing protein [Pirellulales bacterium]
MNVAPLLLILAALAAPPEFTAQLSDGPQVTGTLVELSANRTVLETAAGRRDLGQIIELRRQQPVTAKRLPLHVDLWDGSSLAATSYRTEGKQALVTLADGSQFSFGQNLVASVRFHDQSADVARQWTEILRAGRTDDVLVVRKQDSLDALTGVIGDVGAEKVPFTLGDETIQVKLAKVEGLVYARPADAQPLQPAFCTLSDASGTRLAAHQVVIDDDRARVTSPSGLKLDMPLDRLEQVRFNVQYLSDLAPERIVYTPLLGSSQATKADRAFFAPRLNRGLEPGSLRLGDRSYAKGLTMYSRSEVVFRLPGAFGRLVALAGIDDAVRPGGNVRLSIYGDNRLLVEEVLTGRDPPRKLDVDIRGVARLKIVADFNGDEVADHLDLCEARILE